MTRVRFVPMPGSLISALDSAGATVVAATSSPMVRFRLEASSLIHGDFSICSAMSGSGSRIAGRQIHSRFRLTAPHSRAPGIATSASFAGAVLLRRPGAYGPQFELPSAPPRRLTATVSVSLFRSAIDLCSDDLASERLTSAKPVVSQADTPACVIYLTSGAKYCLINSLVPGGLAVFEKWPSPIIQHGFCFSIEPT